MDNKTMIQEIIDLLSCYWEADPQVQGSIVSIAIKQLEANINA